MYTQELEGEGDGGAREGQGMGGGAREGQGMGGGGREGQGMGGGAREGQGMGGGGGGKLGYCSFLASCNHKPEPSKTTASGV